MKNRTGIKLNPEILKSHIAEVIYEDREVGGHRVITCHLKMDNGFVVWGKDSSTSIDPKNFDEELGKKLAYDKTFSQLWELEAYRAMVEKDALSKSTELFEIDIQQYEIGRHSVVEMSGPDFIRGRGQLIIFHHPRDPQKGFYATFVNTENTSYDEKHNSELREKVKNYLLSFMTAEDLNSDLVIRIAKVCYAAYVGVTDDERSWQDLKDIERRRICDDVKVLLLEPVGGLDKGLNTKDRMYKSIVDSFK